ncbi:MAG TPA: hypothetical protein VMS31_18625 [Pyrinomonadaceae bacterium]|nr:hypothetical protein [Pyrinomonadaceae bacterium]
MKQRFTSATVMLLLVSVGMACSLTSKTPLTWHILLETDAAGSDLQILIPRTVTIIEQRLNAAGVPSFRVVAQGSPPNGRILVNLAEVPDRQRLIELITSRGQLELTAIVSPPSPSPVQAYNSKDAAVASLGGKVPENRSVLPYTERNDPFAAQQNSADTEKAREWVVIETPAIVDGNEIRNAAARHESGQDYHVSFALKANGAERLGAWTGAHLNDYIGVVLNGEVKSIAYIRSQIHDQGEISGRFSKHAAEDLALILRLGPLPSPVRIVEQGSNK